MIRRPRRSTLFPYTTLFRSERLEVLALACRAVNRLERGRRVVCDQRRGEGADRRGRGGPEELGDGRRLEPAVAVGDRGVEQRGRVAQRALGPADDHGQRRGLERDLLFAQDALEGVRERVGRDRPEVEALHAREHRGRDVARVGRREHEDDVARRLLERLQQRVEGGLGELVDLVDDVDLVAAPCRRVLHVLAQRADLLDAAVRRAVDLEHVHEGAGQRLAADRARAAGLGPGAVGAEERPREQARRRRLADAAGAGEEVGVGYAAGRERVPERPRDRVLPDDRVERLRSPLPREDLIGQVTVHPPSIDPYCELPITPAPVRYSHGTREGRLTVAPFRAWRGSTILVAWGPTFDAAP